MAGKIQQALVLIKPDGLKKSLTGNILTKIAEARLRIVGTKVVRVSKELAEKHYAHLKDKPFFDEVIRYIQGKLHGKEYERVLAFVYQGEDAIERIRKLSGSTNPEEADPTTIRGAYGRILRSGIYENVIHCSGNPEEAEREIKLWFKPDEVVDEIYPTKIIKKTNTEERVWSEPVE